METANETEQPKKPSAPKNKLAIIGFICMAAGPALLLFLEQLHRWIGHFPASIAVSIAIFLPGCGAVISIISLILRKSGKLGRALSIVTLIMCNPFFYAYYIFICAIMTSTLAGLPLM
jgi:hypothetical protein